MNGGYQGKQIMDDCGCCCTVIIPYLIKMKIKYDEYLLCRQQ